MKHLVPCPKSIPFTGKTVPAAFMVKTFNSAFAPAIRAFEAYAQRAFGSSITDADTLALVLEPGLDDGYRISIGEKTVLTASNNTETNYAFATLLQLA